MRGSNVNFSSFEAVGIKELLARGWKLVGILKTCMALDYENVKGMGKSDEGTFRQWLPILHKSPETAVMLLDPEGRMVGYKHSLALKKKYFKLEEEGKLSDSRIRANAVYSLDRAGSYYIYDLIITLKEEYRDTGLVGMIDEGYLDMAERLAEKGVFFIEMCRCAYTEDGEKRAVRAGMRRVGTHSGHNIYVMGFYDFLRKNAAHRRKLLELYSKAQ